MGKRAGGKDFSPRVRSIIDQVLETMEKSGDARKLLKKQFEDDFAGTLRAVASFAPKQVDMTLDQQLTVDTTQLSKDVLTQLFSQEQSIEDNQSPDTAVH
jgi:hypothetical protein